MKNVKSNTRHSVITAEHLARKMNILLENDKHMMRATTQKGIRIAMQSINRRYREDPLDLNTYIFSGKWYVDWILAGTKSPAQNAGDFVFSDRTFT